MQYAPTIVGMPQEKQDRGSNFVVLPAVAAGGVGAAVGGQALRSLLVGRMRQGLAPSRGRLVNQRLTANSFRSPLSTPRAWLTGGAAITGFIVCHAPAACQENGETHGLVGWCM